MDAATANLVLVVAGSLAPAAVWLLVPLHDAASRAADLIVWTLFGSFAAFADRVASDDYRGADAD